MDASLEDCRGTRSRFIFALACAAVPDDDAPFRVWPRGFPECGYFRGARFLLWVSEAMASCAETPAPILIPKTARCAATSTAPRVVSQ